ncbi:MAG: hypothetical protein U0L12_03205 [Ruminococcus sp.]|nr:hypothetical protein [Ruminococcus sp.]
MAEEFTISPTNKSKGEISGQNRKKNCHESNTGVERRNKLAKSQENLL